jgi:hypothetical protein
MKYDASSEHSSGFDQLTLIDAIYGIFIFPQTTPDLPVPFLYFFFENSCAPSCNLLSSFFLVLTKSG